MGHDNHDNEVQIEPALTATDEVRSLVGELETVLSAEYSPEQRHGLTLDAIFQPNVRFFLALGWSLDGPAATFHGREHQPMVIALSPGRGG